MNIHIDHWPFTYGNLKILYFSIHRVNIILIVWNHLCDCDLSWICASKWWHWQSQEIKLGKQKKNIQPVGGEQEGQIYILSATKIKIEYK